MQERIRVRRIDRWVIRALALKVSVKSVLFSVQSFMFFSGTRMMQMIVFVVADQLDHLWGVEIG